MEAQILFAHFLVGEEAARGDDRRLRANRDLVARLVRRFNADDAAVFFNELLAPGFREELLAGFLVLLLEEVDPARAAAFIDVPGVEAVRIVREELFELHAVLLHPVDRVGGALDESAHHAGVAAPVAVVHDLHERFVLREAVVPVLLHLGLDSEDAFAELARAAGEGLLFERDDVEALFGCRPRCRRAGGACADHDDVGRERLVRAEGGRHHNCRSGSRRRHDKSRLHLVVLLG